MLPVEWRGSFPRDIIFPRQTHLHADSLLCYLLNCPLWFPRVYQAVWLSVAVRAMGTKFWFSPLWSVPRSFFIWNIRKNIYFFIDLMASIISSLGFVIPLSLTLCPVAPNFIHISVTPHPNDLFTGIHLNRLWVLWWQDLCLTILTAWCLVEDMAERESVGLSDSWMAM